MLLLIFADWNMGRAIKQNVGSHEAWIGEEAERGVLAVFACLVLELRHAAHPANARNAVKYPSEFRMLHDAALIEDDASLGINACGQKCRRDFAGRLNEFSRIRRHGQRVHIDDTVDAFLRLLNLYPPLDRTQIIAEVKISGRLDAGEDKRFKRAHDFILMLASAGGERRIYECRCIILPNVEINFRKIMHQI